MSPPVELYAPDKEKVTWRGAPMLRQSLLAIESLEPFPGNPRIGDVPALRASLRRFGQTKPIVIALGPGNTVRAGERARIVAGHHVVKAAEQEGWTHVAVVANEFATDDEARAYLLADNRTAELGPGNDLALLVAQMQALQDAGALDGTGWTESDLVEHVRRLEAQENPAEPPLPSSPAQDVRREVRLLYSLEDAARFDEWARVVAKERGTEGISETCFAALELAARTLNQS